MRHTCLFTSLLQIILDLISTVVPVWPTLNFLCGGNLFSSATFLARANLLTLAELQEWTPRGTRCFTRSQRVFKMAFSVLIKLVFTRLQFLFRLTFLFDSSTSRTSRWHTCLIIQPQNTHSFSSRSFTLLSSVRRETYASRTTEFLPLRQYLHSCLLLAFLMLLLKYGTT